MRALVVDDSSTMRALLRMMLRKNGFETAEATNGADALDKLGAAGPFDVALVDWNMPRMNGYEFVCAARADHSHDATKFVMVTTETEIEHVQSCLRHGADEYIMKPFTSEIVAEKLQILGLLPQSI